MKTLIFFFVVFFFVPFYLLAQLPTDFNCAPVGEDARSNVAISGGLFKPSQNAAGEYLRVLVAFVQFEGDNSYANNWQSGHLPSWAYQFINTTPSGQYTNETLSDFWDEMALGEFDVIGDFFPDLIMLPPESTYADDGKNFSHTNLDALEIIDSYIPHEGGSSFSWSSYDNWEYDPGTQSFVFNEGNADGYVDMIFMIYRNATYKIDPNDPDEDPGEWFGGGWGAFSGAATLGNIPFNFRTNDNLIVSSGDGWVSALGSGITCRNGGPQGKWGVRQSMAHEYGHYLFGAGHTNYGGIMGGSTNALNAWERIRLGYIVADFASVNGYESVLGDFIATGDVLKISVPFNDLNSTTYFLVENHQRTSSYDHIVRGGSIQGGLDYTGIGKGMFVYLVKNGNSYPGSQHELLTGDGRWNWQLVGEIQMPSGWPPYMPLIDKTGVNRNTGKSNRYPAILYWGHLPEVKYTWWGIWHTKDSHSGVWNLTRNVMGDEKDAFNLGYNELITPWSNPNTYVQGSSNFISIQLLEQESGVITVKTFSTYTSSLGLPPSKPQYLRVSANPGNHYVRLDWDANLETDVSSYEVSRKVDMYGNIWQVVANTTNIYWVDNEYYYCGGGAPGCDWGCTYRIRAKDNTNKYSVYSDEVVTDAQHMGKEIAGNSYSENFVFNLSQNYPNPFNPATRIEFALKENGLTTLRVYDMLGQEVATLVNEQKPAGTYSVEFNGENLPSGIYFYQLKTGGFIETKKMLLIK